MQEIGGFFASRGLKILITIKVLVAVFVLIEHVGWLSFGEKSLRASDEAPAASARAPRRSPADEDGQPRRRSFLDDLLTLPTINTDALKKDEVNQYLTLVQRRQKQIEERLLLLSRREEQLKELERSIESKISKLEEEVRFFHDTQQKEKKIKQERLARLVEFYKKMEPKKAAPVFENMDRDLVVALFKEFPDKQTMNILAQMDPQKSVELTEYFGRIRSAKEYELLKEINLSLRDEFQECRGMPRGESH